MSKKNNNSHTGKLGFAANKQAAAARCAISIESVDSAQKAGCTAFRSNGNVQCDELLQWISKNPESTNLPPVDFKVERALKTRAERQLKEIQRDQVRGDLIHIDAIRAGWTRHVAKAKSQLLSFGASVSPLAMVKFGLSKTNADELQKLIDARSRSIAENFAASPWTIETTPTTPTKSKRKPKSKAKPKPKAKTTTRTKATTKPRYLKPSSKTPGKLSPTSRRRSG
jgi:hypothetical protein